MRQARESGGVAEGETDGLLCRTKDRMAKGDKKGEKKKPGGKPQEEVQRLVSENRKARFRFEILDTLECGIQLTGSEVKSLRDGKLSLDEAYARVKEGEVWLVGADIAEYPQATLWNHVPKRPRKLLMRRRQIELALNSRS